MIAQPSIGNYLKGLLQYNDEKVALNEAKFLFANNLTNSIKTFELQYNTLVGIRENKNNLLHVSLNFHADDRDKLTDEALISITKDFLGSYGLPHDHPFLVYRHFDKNHPHVHVALPLFKDNDESIETHNMIAPFKKICRAIEAKYGLKVAQKKSSHQDVSVENQPNFETAFQAVEFSLRNAMKKRPTSLEELERILDRAPISYNGGQHYIGLERSKKFNGITFFVKSIDRDKKLSIQDTRGIKGSKISGFSYPKMVLEFTRNESIKQKRTYTIRETINTFLNKTKGFNEFNDTLTKNGIRPTYFYTKDKQIFGVEFLDIQTNMSFKGSDLSKDLSWNKLKLKFKIPSFEPANISFSELEIPLIQSLNLHFEAIKGIKIVDLEHSESKKVTINFAELVKSFEGNTKNVYNTLAENLLLPNLIKPNPNVDDLISLLRTAESIHRATVIQVAATPELATTAEISAKKLDPIKPIKMNAKELKENIDMVDFLVDKMGWKITDGKQNVSKWITLQKPPDEIDTVIVVKNTGGYNHYTNPDNPAEKGSILDFLINKGHVDNISAAISFLNNDKGVTVSQPIVTATTTTRTEKKPFRAIHNYGPITQNDYVIKGHGNPYVTLRQFFPEYVSSIDHETLRSELTKLYGKDGVSEFMPVNAPAFTYNVFPLFDITRMDEKVLVGQEVINKDFKHIVGRSDKENGAWFARVKNQKSIIATESPSKSFAYLALTGDKDCSPFATMGNPSNQVVKYLASLSATGGKVILGGDNDPKGQLFNFRIAAEIIKQLHNVNIRAGILPGAVTNSKEFVLTLESIGPDQKVSAEKNIERFQTMATRTSVKFETIGTSAVLKLPLTGEDFTDSEKMNALLKEFVYIYALNTPIAKPTLKDFNDDLLTKENKTVSNRIKL